MSVAAASPAEQAESAKRRQIMEGAREMFLAQGFDGASMGEIARARRRLEGHALRLFRLKEHLFQAIVEEECQAQAEQVFALDLDDHDVEAQFLRLGRDFVRFLCTQPGSRRCAP